MHKSDLGFRATITKALARTTTLGRLATFTLQVFYLNVYLEMTLWS